MPGEWLYKGEQELHIGNQGFHFTMFFFVFLKWMLPFLNLYLSTDANRISVKNQNQKQNGTVVPDEL